MSSSKDPLASLNPYNSLKEEPGFADIYTPLTPRSTRFLRYKKASMLKSPQSDQLMTFELEVYSLDQNRPEYVALSYTWGHPVQNDFKDDLSHAIICNGHHFPIGLNLYEALHYLFIESDIAPELIWIDAVCIDQSNVEERGVQVKQMTSIYLHATRVIIWLGTEDQDSKEASGFFNEYTPVLRKLLLAEVTRDPTSTLQANLHNVYDDLSFHQKYNTTSRDLDKWKSLMRFFSRRWFWRVWVVQELAYAQSNMICCGGLRFNWSDMDVFIACVFGAQWCGFNLADELKMEILDIANVFTLHREISMMVGGINDPSASMQLGLNERIYSFAEYCLTQTAVLHATDPRDKIFALFAFIASYSLRLGSNSRLKWLNPDYTLDVNLVMVLTTAITMQETHSIDLLSYVSDPSERAESTLPTWVPHFHIQGDVATLETLLRIHQNASFHAGTISAGMMCVSNVALQFETSTLMVNGSVLDKVVEVVHFEHTIFELLDICLRLPLQYKNGQPPVEVLWRTLIAGRTDTAFPAPPETAQYFSEYITTTMIGHVIQNTEVKSDDGALSALSRILISIGQYCPHPTIPSPDEFVSIAAAARENLGDFIARCQNIKSQGKYRTLITPTHAGRRGKAVFRTQKGYLGLCPYSTQIDDEVWLFKGAKVLYILKAPVVEGESQELVGESYLHGFMEGEGLAEEGLTPQIGLIK